MAFATVRGAAEEAAKRGKLTPHQLAALTALDQSLTDEQRRLFTEAWRSEGSPAAAPAPNPFAAVKPLLDLIAAGEGDYDSVNRGKAGDTPAGWPGLERLTIGAVQKLQSEGTLFAVGRYQFIPATLRMAVEAAGFRSSDVFSPETQDWLAVALLLGGKRPLLRDYLQGKDVSLEAAQEQLALEWASIPMANGKGAYDGDSAGNKATAKVAKVQSALKAARAGMAGRTLPQLRLPAQQPVQRPLPVRYFRQTDSALAGAHDSSAADEMCFSSTCAMLAEFLKPGSFPGPQGDDAYLKKLRAMGGSTTDPQAHVKLLNSMGIAARFITNGDWSTMERQLAAGIPVPVGWLHHGPASRPTGGGHWSLAVDLTKDLVVMHDANGEADLVNGGYLANLDGKGQRYSRKNWGPRWLVDGPKSGWMLQVSR
jgi:muramidase (phage lysozyme)